MQPQIIQYAPSGISQKSKFLESSMDIAGPTNQKKLHIAMFPWLAFGHIIPFLELAKLIAQKGHKISFISTPRNIKRLPKIPQHLTPFIIFVELPLPHEPNLPENAESTMDVPPHIVPFLKIAHDRLDEGLHHFLESSSPDWIIHDFAPHWLPPIASKLGIPRVHFTIFNAFTVNIFGPVSPELRALYKDVMPTQPEHLTTAPKWVPFPTKVAFRMFEAKQIMGLWEVNDSGVSDFDRYAATTNDCDALAIRSCMELEAEWFDVMAKLFNQTVPILPVSLIPPSIQIHEYDEHKNKEDDVSWGSIVSWLDKQEKGSVIYVALGSEARPRQEEYKELALGLELCGSPFFWALRKANGAASGKPVELPEGFEERTRGRGHVWTSWAPQKRILAHEAVGGFLTHCGMSSVVEGLQFGCSLVLLPFFLDQGLIARVLEDKKVGFEIPRDEEHGFFTRKDVAESIRLVMIDEEGKVYRDGAKEMSLMIRNKEIHHGYIDKFVSFLENYKHVSRV